MRRGSQRTLIAVDMERVRRTCTCLRETSSCAIATFSDPNRFSPAKIEGSRSMLIDTQEGIRFPRSIVRRVSSSPLRRDAAQSCNLQQGVRGTPSSPSG